MTMSSLENITKCLRHEPCERLPTILEVRSMNSRIIRDNIARGTVRDGREKLPYNPDGEADAFGVVWVFDEATNGAMEKPGVPFLLDDVSEWRDVISFPNPDEWDWEGEANASAAYLGDPETLYKSTIFTGFFERLISFMGFEEAAISLADEDLEEDIVSLFDRLADYYICLISHMKESFGIGLVEIHDDWGSQTAPFFSEDTLRRIIIPSLKRVVDHAHSLGVFVELHSCGRIEPFVPVMIETGIDLWMGQDHNDKARLVADYGDRIVIECEFPKIAPDATDEQIEAAAHAFVGTFILKGKVPVMSVYGYAYDIPEKLKSRIFELSAEKLATF